MKSELPIKAVISLIFIVVLLAVPLAAVIYQLLRENISKENSQVNS